MNKKSNKQLSEMIKKELYSHESDANFLKLKERFGLKDFDIFKMYEFYDSDVHAYKNAIYENLEIRFVQYLHSRKYGSWHIEKSCILNKWIGNYWPCHIVDVGYGIPQKYLLERVHIKNSKGSFLLLEKYEKANIFAQELISFYCQNKKEGIALKKFDMDVDSMRDIGEKDLYLFLDSLEHAKNPSQVLIETIQSSHSESKYIFSLPISEQVPVHHISWESKEDIVEWLKTFGLKIDRLESLKPNPKVDIFVNSVHGEFFNLLIECSIE